MLKDHFMFFIKLKDKIRISTIEEDWQRAMKTK